MEQGKTENMRGIIFLKILFKNFEHWLVIQGEFHIWFHSASYA